MGMAELMHMVRKGNMKTLIYRCVGCIIETVA